MSRSTLAYDVASVLAPRGRKPGGKAGVLNRGAFFIAAESLQHQKPIGGNAQTRMMMKASPVASLEVAQPKLLFEFLVIQTKPHRDTAPNRCNRQRHRHPAVVLLARLTTVDSRSRGWSSMGQLCSAPHKRTVGVQRPTQKARQLDCLFSESAD